MRKRSSGGDRSFVVGPTGELRIESHGHVRGGAAANDERHAPRSSSSPPPPSVAHPAARPAVGVVSGVVAFILDRQVRTQVQRELADYGGVQFCDWPDDLCAAVRDRGASAAVVELRDQNRRPTAELIASLRAEFPLTAVIAYVAPAASTPQEILAAVRAGANGLVVRGTDDVGVALRSALTIAQDEVLARYALAELSAVVPPNARGIVEYCLMNARQSPAVRAVAAALEISPKTLVNRLAVARMPSPRDLINWCRLLLAARMLDDPARSVERVALALGFRTAPSLRNVLRRYTGLRPSDIRDGHGFLRILDRLRERIEQGA